MLTLRLRTSYFWLVLLWLIGFSEVLAASANQTIDIDSLRKIYSQASKNWPKMQVQPGVEAKELGLIETVTFPSNNPFSPAKMRLGETLFHDGRLSRSGQIACASCHDRDLGWADGRQLSFGHDRRRGKRNAPSVENIAFAQSFFWDGRAATLEQQALMPIQDSLEMNFTLVELEQRLNAIKDYQQQFKLAFGDNKVTAKRIGMALATYQRTIISRLSAFDRLLMAERQQNERVKQAYMYAMSDQAILGLHLFRTKAGCMNCHSGPTFSDQQFHNIGLTYYGRKYEDLGRYNVTAQADDVGRFKTPMLRGVMNTKPWMHNGLFGSMRGIINIYNAGGVVFNKDPDDPLSPQTSPLLKPLNLTQVEIDALVEFMSAISASPARGPKAQFIKAAHKEGM